MHVNYARGDVSKHPPAQVDNKVEGEVHTMVVGLTDPHLLKSVLLGRDFSCLPKS